ncbi:MAG TPA: DUF6293 family protein [Methanocella sp.]|uniref:HFX_2341 family transcriptional regulator domain-containing protein n=1 Tax=Methanocella sp. TaxID=2052833 RepID=UPI002BD6EC4E|nr:DUF6293 family protein [Methanocella sp.]HTY91415.1 DUF6293 family protein [Methanocella sp.]
MSKPGVHIIPAGLEYDRVVKPLLKDFTVSKAYLLINENLGKDFGKQKEIIDRFRRSIKKVPIEWEEIEVDIYDFNKTFQTVYSLINKEALAGNPVYINISSSPKILLVALIMAAFMNKEHGEVELFYVEPEKYYDGEVVHAIMQLLDKKADEKNIVNNLRELAKEIEAHGMAAGEARIHEFPPFPIAEITDIEYDMLRVIRDANVPSTKDQDLAGQGSVSSIKELKERLDDKLGKVTPRSNVKYYLDNLQRMGLVRTERDKKELNIRLTKVGELFADTKGSA